MPEADLVTAPLALLNPSIDGLVTDFFEWRGAGRIKTQPPLGAMWKAEGVLADIRFGWSLDHLYLRLDPDEQVQTRQVALTVELHLQTPADSYRLSFSLAASEADHFCSRKNWQAEPGRRSAPTDRSVIEISSNWLCLSRTCRSQPVRSSAWPLWCWNIVWRLHVTRTTILQPSSFQVQSLKRICGECDRPEKMKREKQLWSAIS